MFTTKKAAPGILGVLALALVASAAYAAPPYDGTVWLDPDMIEPGDTTTFVDHLPPTGRGVQHRGNDSRLMMHVRNPDRFSTLSAHIYDAWYDADMASQSGRMVEIEVNPDFPEWRARALANRYAGMLGQLPRVLRDSVDEVEINPGDYSASGFHRGWACSIYLYADMMEAEWNEPFAEEIILHEAAHCLEGEHRDTAGWKAAQRADPGFISQHAENHPHQEDFAETFSAWTAVRYRLNRIDDGIAETIGNTIPNRLAYLDGAISEEDMAPFAKPEPPPPPARLSSYILPYLPRPGVVSHVIP